MLSVASLLGAVGCLFFIFFFFQAEDGIRDLIVTGVQTCALPILRLVDLQAARDHAREHHHWMVRITHWVTVVVLAGMITSGLQIYEAYARFGNRDRKSVV